MNERRQILKLSDGRKLEVVTAGDKKGRAIFIHNGTPQAAGFLQEHINHANKNNLYLISYGRPGYGESSRKPGRTVASAAQDTADIADALDIQKFATWGNSGGGPHALACAALLGDRVLAAASIAGVAPYYAEGLDFMEGMGEDNIEEFSAALKGEETLIKYLEPQKSTMLNLTSQEMAEHMGSLLSPADQAVFSNSFGEQLATNMKNSLTNGIDGWLDDDLAFTKRWGFSLSDIRVPLQIWQGEQDLMVPYTHGEWLSKSIPQAESHLSTEEGHLTLLVNRIPEIHDWMISYF